MLTRTQPLQVLYVKRKINSGASAALDANHTHFLCVENGKDEYGGEIRLRCALESALASRLKVPAGVLVVQGGPGTYATVRTAVESGQRIILVKESHGAAQVSSRHVHAIYSLR